MSTASEIKAHLKAVEETRQITNAMYLLSTSRMKQAMQNIDFNLYYMKTLRSNMKQILSKTLENGLSDKFIIDNKLGSAVLVVVTSDKGLCGGYNHAVTDLAISEMKRHKSPVIISLGLIGDHIFRSNGLPVAYSWYGASQHPTLHLAADVAEKLIELYLTNDYHEVYVIYTEYVNSVIQTPKCVKLLPLLKEDFEDVESNFDPTDSLIYEPSPQTVFERLVYHYVTGFMYDVFMQSAASENIARMNAMQSATKNADEMIRKLTDQLNAERQLQITSEITEISAAAQNGV